MKYKILGISCVAILTSISACQTPKLIQRAPNQVTTGADESSAVVSDNEEMPGNELVSAIFNNEPDSVTRLSSYLRSIIQVVAWSQQLASSYDLYLDTKIAEAKADYDNSVALLSSELNCKLWEAFYVNEATEEELSRLQKALLQKASQEKYEWFLQFFRSTKHDTPAQVLAKAHLARFLSYEYNETCSQRSCPAFGKFPGKPAAAFDPFNDQEMLAFKQKFATKIAIYTGSDLMRMPKGHCQDSGGDRQPNAETPLYDWKLRNKVGRALRTGEFIFTYDDGPHPKYTQQIAEAWGQSGMAKPTFFWLAANVQKYPAVARDVGARGFEVAVHSFSHPDIGNLAAAVDASKLNKVNRTHFANELRSLSAGDFAGWREKKLDQQIVRAFAIISDVLGSGHHVGKFRLPYGSGLRSSLIGARFAHLNVDHFFWDIDSLDWQDKNPLSIVERVHKQMLVAKRGIILFHDIHPQSLEASKVLIREFQEKPNGKVVNLNEAQL